MSKNKASISSLSNETSRDLSTTDNEVELKLPNPNLQGNRKNSEISAIKSITVDNSTPAHNHPEFMAGFALMLSAGNGQAEFDNPYELPMLREAFRRHKVYPKEAVDAFWQAYGDPYVKANKIKFRHLWKYIEKKRLGRDRQLYSYREMVAICDDEGVSTDHFERNDELAKELKEQKPKTDVADLKVWRRL